MKNLQNPKLVTLNDVFEYLHTALSTFADDPADSDFQRGYQQALSDMRYDFLGVSPTESTALSCLVKGGLRRP